MTKGTSKASVDQGDAVLQVYNEPVNSGTGFQGPLKSLSVLCSHMFIMFFHNLSLCMVQSQHLLSTNISHDFHNDEYFLVLWQLVAVVYRWRASVEREIQYCATLTGHRVCSSPDMSLGPNTEPSQLLNLNLHCI